MFRKNNINSTCIAIGACVFIILTGYRYLNDFGYRACPKTIYQTSQNYPGTESQNYVDTILEMTRMMIKVEMWNYTFAHSGVDKLEDLVLESGGTPIRIIVVSSWRMGSSFLGELINAAPGSFYSYEPLKMFDIYKQIRGPPHANRATRVIKNILKCNFNNETDMMKYFAFTKKALKVVNHFSHNKRLWDKCSYKQELCFDAEFNKKFCELFPFQTIKLDRFRLHLANNLLEDKELNARVVLLVRDPRGVMQSRRHIKNFCSTKKVPDCEKTELVCSDLVSDYKTAANFLHKYPERLMVLRYEDLAFNIEATTVQLLKFLRIEPTKSFYEYLKTHTTVSNSQHYSTFRVTKSIPYKWKKALKFKAVKEIQEKCREAMSLWGYAVAHNASHMTSKDFNALLPYSVEQDSA